MVSELEAVAEGSDIGVLALHELEGMGDNTNRPGINSRVSASLEAEEEVTRVLGVDAEGICRPVGVGVHVGGEPFFCYCLLASLVMNETSMSS